MIDIASKQIIPAVIKYTTVLADSIQKVKAVSEDADTTTQEEMLLETSDLLRDSRTALARLEEVTAAALEVEVGETQALYYLKTVKTAMDALRAPVDKLEMIVDKDMWPMPSYGDLIFEV